MRFVLVVFLVCLQAMLPAGEKKGKLRVLIAGQASTAEMQESIQADAEKMQKAVRAIAKTTKMRLVLTVAQGSQFTVAKVSRWLKSIKGNKDIAVFYYSGKGLSKHKQKWPYVFTCYKNRVEALPGQNILGIMKDKVCPKFALVLFDCYKEHLFSCSKFFPENKKQGSLAGLKNLFGKSRGIITVSSGSDVSNCFFSSGGASKGGLFTSSLLKGLYKSASSKRSNWVQVMEASTKLAKKSGQKPVIEYRAAVLQKK